MKSVMHEATQDISQRWSQIAIEVAADEAASKIQLPLRVSFPIPSHTQYESSRDIEKADEYREIGEDVDELMYSSTQSNDYTLRRLRNFLDLKLSENMKNLLREVAKQGASHQRKSVTSIWSARELTLELKLDGVDDDQNQKPQYAECDSTSQGSDSSQTLVFGSCNPSSLKSSKSTGQRKLLLIRLTKALMRYGAASHRIEECLQMTAEYLEVEMTIVFLPGLSLICFSDIENHAVETLLVKCNEGFDMGKLAKVFKTAISTQRSTIDVRTALDQLHDIKLSPPTWGSWSMLMAYALSSLVAAPVMFQGSWTDGLVSGGLGLLVGVVITVAEKYAIFNNMVAVSICITIGFTVRALSAYICFTGVVLSSIVMLLPGYNLTISIMEFSAQHMITGTIRFGYSLLYALLVGYGLEVGSALYSSVDPALPSDFASCSYPVSEWFYIPLYPIVAITSGMTSGATARQWPAIIACSCFGMGVTYFVGKVVSDSQIVATIGAFAIGLFGRIYYRITGELALVPLCSAMGLLTAGNIGVKGVYLLMQESDDGGSLALQMVVTSVAIAIGLFAAALIPIFPRHKGRSVNLSY
ncbi:hypothetical protein K450DRAFT_260694 [Umbelopsis ramanniana AG]|uniref:Threonine/serine exporter-like N-terminal domain-containing protein n=1 Tax=Umbelopsis ramanniana AG TaxID=1314678 RepID=A0AAD5H8A8_UMBRA|nr:uncharacterized protein K450DRAFT_260694 [Umbelopsis ramanniana AG]KAI8575685.1 hypothetical protein K450DRAFT_260694 [Umbelopsis ramanniana AG]